MKGTEGKQDDLWVESLGPAALEGGQGAGSEPTQNVHSTSQQILQEKSLEWAEGMDGETEAGMALAWLCSPGCCGLPRAMGCCPIPPVSPCTPGCCPALGALGDKGGGHCGDRGTLAKPRAGLGGSSSCWGV